MSKAITDFIKSVGLRSKFNTHDEISSLIPFQRFASEDNKLLLTAVYISDKKIAAELVGDYVEGMDRLIKQGGLEFEYSTFEEIHGIGEKPWAQKLEDYLPYEQRTAEVFSVLKTPLIGHGIRGNGLNVCFSTQDGYYISFTELETSNEVKDEDVEYLLSGQALVDLMTCKT